MNAAGENTSVLYSYAHTICSLLEMPSHLAVHGRGKTSTRMFVEYKANDRRRPNRLGVDSQGGAVGARHGSAAVALEVEADDIIGTVGRRASDEGFSVSICSPDKDFISCSIEDEC